MSTKVDKFKSKLFTAYEKHLRKEPGSTDGLFRVVRDYAYNKVYGLEIDFKEMGSSSTADDWAQDVALKVWEGLQLRERTPSEFHAWVNRIATNAKTDAFDELMDQKTTNLPFFYELEEEGSEETFTEENPLIHEEHEPFTIQIPECVQGLDRHICQFIMDGCSYAAIARMFEMTGDSVKGRMKRLKKKVAAERAKARN